jgi:hypothetical protein
MIKPQLRIVGSEVPQAWLLTVEFVNAAGQVSIVSEYHANHAAAEKRANQFIDKRIATKVSIKKEYTRGDSNEVLSKS